MDRVFDNIRAECARKRWTIEELADKLGVERKTFYNWEKKQDLPVSMLINMSKLFDTSVDKLLGLD
jgi:transcriptional regulator with XRE-family HTH domain